MPPDTTNSTGVLDRLFGTVEKGFDLWGKWQTQKSELTAQQVRQTSVTDVARQPSPDAFTIDSKTVAVGVGVAVAAGVLFWALRSK